MSLQRLEVTPLPTVIAELIAARRTGTLVLAHGKQRTSLDWVNGELVLARPGETARSLGAWLFHKGLVDEETGRRIAALPADEIVPRFHELALFDAAQRNAHLREWTRVVTTPLFSLTEGTAAFEESEPLDPAHRVFFQSPAPLIVEGTRSITNGLVLRSSLGDLTRVVEPDPDPLWPTEDLPLTDREREIARSLEGPTTVDQFLRRWSEDAVVAARVTIALTTLGTWNPIGASPASGTQLTSGTESNDTERDLMLLAQIGPSDVASLEAVKFAKKLPHLDLYETLNLPRGAQGSLIAERAHQMLKEFETSSFPPILSSMIEEIRAAVERSRTILTHPAKRKEYDQLLSRGQGNKTALDQYVARRSIAIRNLERARELALRNDPYGAIVLLRQAVRFDPGSAEAWHLLGSCEQQNPRWRRDAAVSFQKALAADPTYVEAMISLGDLYKLEGLPARARNFYEDALSIEADNATAKSRLAKLDAPDKVKR